MKNKKSKKQHNKEVLKIRQHHKFTDLNKIRKIFDERYNGYCNFSNESHIEQRDYMVRRVIEDLEHNIKKIKCI